MFAFLNKKNDIEHERVNEEKIKKEVLDYIQGFEKLIYSLINKSSFVKESEEMLPPWFVKIYPRNIPLVENLGGTSSLLDRDYWYWRGGEGGSYRSLFLEYWCSLNTYQKKQYFLKYDLGAEWPERDCWFFDLFDESGAIELTGQELDTIEKELLRS